DDVCAEAAGQFVNAFDDGIVLAGGAGGVGGEVLRIDGLGGAEFAGGGELVVGDVDGDDRRRASQLRAGDGGGADAAAADDGHGLAALDVAGVDRRADAGHDAGAEEARDGRIGLRVDLGALALV